MKNPLLENYEDINIPVEISKIELKNVDFSTDLFFYIFSKSSLFQNVNMKYVFFFIRLYSISFCLKKKIVSI